MRSADSNHPMKFLEPIIIGLVILVGIVLIYLLLATVVMWVILPAIHWIGCTSPSAIDALCN